MLIQCPNCDTKYNLDEAVLGPDGSKVRCIRCSHVFFVAPPGAASAPSSDPSSDLSFGPPSGQSREHDPDQEINADFDWLDEVMPGEDRQQAELSSAERAGPSGTDRAAQEISLEIQASEEPRNRALSYVAAGLIAVTLALIVLLYFQQIREAVSSWFGSSDTEEVDEPRVLGPDEVHLISLHNVRQYFVSNEKIGQLFVIEGKARNDFPVPKELFRIEASLFDAAGQVVESKDFLAGNTVSLFQLQILSATELESALSARVGILTNNTNVRPGSDVQFMVVFPNPPEIVQEYGLKVIGAQTPPS